MILKSHEKIDRLLDCIENELKNSHAQGDSLMHIVRESYEITIDILKEQITLLKKDNNDLMDRLMSFNNEALHTYKQVKSYDNPIEVKEKPANPFSILDGIQVETTQDKKEKAEAVSQIASIMGQSNDY